MTRPVLFDSPFLLGFEHMRAEIERAHRASAESYPPYNIEALDERRVRITLAVAGFAPDQLAVTVEGARLTVTGKREGQEREFLHRGIAARGFQRTFVLADGLEVDGATLEHGLLHVDVSRPEDARAVKTIPIKTG